MISLIVYSLFFLFVTGAIPVSLSLFFFVREIIRFFLFVFVCVCSEVHKTKQNKQNKLFCAFFFLWIKIINKRVKFKSIFYVYASRMVLTS